MFEPGMRMFEVIGPDGKAEYRGGEIGRAEREDLEARGYSVRPVKQVEELVAEGGKFYVIEGNSSCDTPLHTWQLREGVGFVRVD